MIIRPGKKDDIPEVFNLIKELAEFEKALNKVTNSIERLEQDGFGPNPVYELFVAENENKIEGMALTYYRYSTWRGKVLSIEDLIVKERSYPEKSKLLFRSASGGMEHLNIFKVSNINSTLKNLREKNFWVYGFDARGEKNFTEVKWEGKNVLLFGSEGFGMKEHTGKYADFFVKIDINKDIESLNISNSAAIVFHHLSYLKKKF